MRDISLPSFKKKCFNCVNLLNKHYHIAAYTHESSNSTKFQLFMPCKYIGNIAQPVSLTYNIAMFLTALRMS